MLQFYFNSRAITTEIPGTTKNITVVINIYKTFNKKIFNDTSLKFVASANYRECQAIFAREK
jgi:hypothetical protein